MAQVSAAMVKELREMTGAGMMECKKALVEADGDMDKAVDVLRTAGLASVAKKAVALRTKAQWLRSFPTMHMQVHSLSLTARPTSSA